MLGNSAADRSVEYASQGLTGMDSWFSSRRRILVDMHILDVGCGLGDVSFLVGDIVGPNGSVMGIDRDPSMIAQASERALERGCSAWVPNSTKASGGYC